MNLTCNKFTALRIIRAIRSSKQLVFGNLPKTNLLPADPSPRTRWASKIVDFSRFGLEPALSSEWPLYVAVDDHTRRVQMRNAKCTVYESSRALPANSFVNLGKGLAISCPELLFVELAEHLETADLLMVGQELCGSFSRNPNNSRNGNVTYDVAPITSVEHIVSYIQQVRFRRGTAQAKYACSLMSNNAWSPTESVVATVMNLPLEEFGYGLGPCVLNKRIRTKRSLAWTTDKSSRVPDILIAGTPVGVNYDGAVHLNLDSVIDAAIEVERHPEYSATQQVLDNVVRDVRAKAIDDIRRNRELAANGYIVFPVVKEDLYEEGGLDKVVAQIIEAIETFGGRDLSRQKRMLNQPLAKLRRQELIWSLMPSRRERVVSRTLRERAFPESGITEVTIGF